MGKVKFQANCPGCDDTHFAIECKKPTLITPTNLNVACDNCESSYLIRVVLPKNRENRNQISFTPIKMKPSEKLLQIWEAKKNLEALANASEPMPTTEPEATPPPQL